MTTGWNAAPERCFELGYAAAQMYLIVRKDISPARRIKALREGLDDLDAKLNALEILPPRANFADVVDACRRAVNPIHNPADADEGVWRSATNALERGLRSLAVRKAASDPVHRWLAVGLLAAFLEAGADECKPPLVRFLGMVGIPEVRALQLAARRQLKQSINAEITSRFGVFWTDTPHPMVGSRRVKPTQYKVLAAIRRAGSIDTYELTHINDLGTPESIANSLSSIRRDSFLKRFITPAREKPIRWLDRSIPEPPRPGPNA